MRFVYKVGIVTSIACFFLMSHNASAADLTYNLNDYDWITSVNLGTQYCAYSYNSFGSSPSICILNENRTKSFGIKSYDLAHEKGDLAQFYVSIQSNIDGSNTQGNFGLYTENFGAINDHFKIIEFREATKEEATPLFDYNQNCTQPNNNSWYCTLEGNADQTYYSKIYKVTILWTDKGSHPVGLYAFNQNTPIFSCKIGSGRFTGEGAQCQIRIFGYTQWGYKGSSVNKEQSEATQNAADESESEAQDNSTNAQTTNLIGAFQSFVNSLSSLNATNCNVTLPFPSSLGGSMQVNICQNKDYAGNIVSVFGSLTLIIFYIPFSLKLLSMIYNEIRSFTNG